MERKLTIYTWLNESAPRPCAWSAAFQECDLDVTCSYGPTEEQAIIDLVRNYDLPEDRS